MAHTNIISIILLLIYYPALQSPTIDNQALSLNQFANEEGRYKSDGSSDLRSSKSSMHNLQNELNSKWPTGKIPYYTNVSSYDYFIAYKLRMIMNMIEMVSCLEFQALMVIPNATSDINWIHFMNPRKERECVHNIDFSQKEIVVVLGYDCLSEVEILHSLMHGIGFKDEVTHPFRDKYIRVLWNNIQFAYQGLYYLRYEDKTAALVEYDPLSVMHFEDRDFSINGRATVEPVVGGLTISPTRGLSQLDKLKLNLYFSYACNKREVKKILKTCKNTLHEEADIKKNKDGLEKSTEVKIEKVSSFVKVSKEKTSEESKNVLNGEADSGAEDLANNTTHIFEGAGVDRETSADSSAEVGSGTGLNSILHKDAGVDSSAGSDGIGLNSRVNKSIGIGAVGENVLNVTIEVGANTLNNAGANDGTLLGGMAGESASGDDSIDANSGASVESNAGEDGGTLLNYMADKGASGDDSEIADSGVNDEINAGADGSRPVSGMADEGESRDDSAVADGGVSDESNAREDGGTLLNSMANKGGWGNEDKGSDSGTGTSVEGSDGADSEADKTKGGASALRHERYKKKQTKNTK